MAYHDVPRRNVATYGMAYYGMLRHAVAQHDMLNTVGMGPPYGCGRPMRRVLNMFGMGRPMAASTLWLRPAAEGENAEPGSLEQAVSPKSHYFFLRC